MQSPTKKTTEYNNIIYTTKLPPPFKDIRTGISETNQHSEKRYFNFHHQQDLTTPILTAEFVKEKPDEIRIDETKEFVNSIEELKMMLHITKFMFFVLWITAFILVYIFNEAYKDYYYKIIDIANLFEEEALKLKLEIRQEYDWKSNNVKTMSLGYVDGFEVND